MISHGINLKNRRRQMFPFEIKWKIFIFIILLYWFLKLDKFLKETKRKDVYKRILANIWHKWCQRILISFGECANAHTRIGSDFKRVSSLLFYKVFEV